MLKIIKLTPPQHGPDDAPSWIANGDKWDNDRIDAEKKRLADQAVANLPKTATDEERTKAREAAEARHPVEVWRSGATRYSIHPDAVLTVPEVLRTGDRPAPAVPITDYLLADPTVFELQPIVDAIEWRRCLAGDPSTYDVELVRRGLALISGVDIGDGKATTVIPDRDDLGHITTEWINDFDLATKREIIGPLSTAIFNLSRGGAGEAEGKL